MFKPASDTCSADNPGFCSLLNTKLTPITPAHCFACHGYCTKGAEASWDDDVLSFSVTEQALTSDGVLIELCSGGVGEQGLVASGTISGDVTMQLICRLRSKRSGGGHPSGDAAAASASESLSVEVRLFAKDASKHAGVCSLNLNFRPDEGNETSNGIEGPNLLQAKARREPETPTATPDGVMTAASPAEGGVAEGAGHRQSSLMLLEETARHIEAIEEVRFRASLRPSLAINDAGIRK